MRAFNRPVRRLAAAASFLLCAALAAPALAGPNGCPDGMQTLYFAGGVYDPWDPWAPSIAERCAEAWNDHGQSRSDSGSYFIETRAFWLVGPWSHHATAFSCITCVDMGSPVTFDPLNPLGPYHPPGPYGDMFNQAGTTATDAVGGVLLKVERQVRYLGEDKTVFLVDVLTEKGQVQVLVDGETGEPTVIPAVASETESETATATATRE